MLQKLINRIFSNPTIFIVIRRILENNFKGEKKAIREELKTEGKTLDIACGTGEFCVFFDKSNYLGVDLSKKYINYARKKYGYNFQVADATKMNIKSEFDNILICGLFHHLNDNDVLKILESSYKMSKNNGSLLVMEDIPTRSKFNFLGKIVQKFDVGKFIRKHEEYGRLYSSRFNIVKDYKMRTGVNDYSVYVLQK
ncbi:MAG TPA: class I SAM-dependent methyltransferase [Candidatus Nanoarchaeia archaeon]|nr:class I SAM-dependent methyltransferase [Candidatus Nanoarchaeia archaeon]